MNECKLYQNIQCYNTEQNCFDCIIKMQEGIPPEFSQIIDENFWDLIKEYE